MRALPGLVQAAAELLGLSPDGLVPLAGETGQVYAVDGRILRVGPSWTIDIEEAAAARAAAVVPVSRVLARVDHELGSAMLMARMPGSPAWNPGIYDPVRARRRGLACGRAQLSLSTIGPPPQMASARSSVSADPAAPEALLHLDLHPLNILLGEDDQVTAVLDWANAAAGPAEYDRARTATILHLDPSARQLRHDRQWRAFVDGWTEGAQLDAISAGSIAWACRYMLADLTARHTAQALRPVEEALQNADSATMSGDSATFALGSR